MVLMCFENVEYFPFFSPEILGYCKLLRANFVSNLKVSSNYLEIYFSSPEKKMDAFSSVLSLFLWKGCQ